MIAGQANNKAPIVSNGLFGGTDLKDDDADKVKKSNLNSIFDYEVEEEEK